MEIAFLGTGSAYPSPCRGASCLVFRHDGTYWMFDCGEGSQIQLQKSSIRPGRITKIFITHLHGDHMFGLPGLMCTISQRASAESETRGPPLRLYGPTGLRKFVRTSLQLSRSQLLYNYAVDELHPLPEQYSDDWQSWNVDHTAVDELHPNEVAGIDITQQDGVWHVCEEDRLTVQAGWLKHRIPCFGYVICEKPTVGKLDMEKLRARGVPPGPLCAKVKAGETITAPDGSVIRPCDVIGDSRPGRKVVILGDTCDSSQMSRLCTDADIIVHEATLSNEMRDSALEKGHSTPEMAGCFARSVGARHLVLTHFSQRYRPQSYLPTDGDSDETTRPLEAQAKVAFNSDKVFAVDDFSVVTLGVKSLVDGQALVSLLKNAALKGQANDELDSKPTSVTQHIGLCTVK